MSFPSRPSVPRRTLALVAGSAFATAAAAQWPADPTADIPWTPASAYGSVADVAAAFNHARATEEVQLGITLPDLAMPSQSAWNAMSDAEKVLYLTNEARTARGVAPLQGIDPNVTSVAQTYANYLDANHVINHTVDGRTPAQRLTAHPRIGGHVNSLNYPENLFYLRYNSTSGPPSIPMPAERYVYWAIYEDQAHGWGHRHACLYSGFIDDYGAPGAEGLIGLGVAAGPTPNHNPGVLWEQRVILVFNVIDPDSTYVPGGATGPANDECSGALAIQDGASGPYSNAGATTSVPSWTCASGGSDVWFRYVASCGGTATIDTCGMATDFDTTLEVFGGTCGSLSSLSCNDDACNGRTSSVTFNTVANTAYLVRVGGYSSATGTFSLNVNCAGTPSISDECISAVPVTLGVNGPFSNIGATDSQPAWACGSGAADVWFSYTASCDASVTFDTCSAALTFDTVIEAFTGNCVLLNPVACNDDSCAYGSSLTVAANAGTTYFVRVGGYSGATGAFELTVTQTGNGTFDRTATGCGGLTITESGSPNLGGNLAVAIGGRIRQLGDPVRLRSGVAAAVCAGAVRVRAAELGCDPGSEPLAPSPVPRVERRQLGLFPGRDGRARRLPVARLPRRRRQRHRARDDRPVSEGPKGEPTMFTFLPNRAAGVALATVLALPVTLSAQNFPPHPTQDIPWSPRNFGGVADVEAAFNAARAAESLQLGISLPPLSMPSQSTWDGMSASAKGLFLINDERAARNLAPYAGADPNVAAVAQGHADWMLQNHVFDHQGASGLYGDSRLAAHPAIGGHEDPVQVGEALSAIVTPVELAVEQSVYGWLYHDSCCNWGHREGMLWIPFTDNHGAPGEEALIGIGHARGGPWNGFGAPEPVISLVVFNIIDPASHYDPNRTVGYDECAGAIPIRDGVHGAYFSHAATTSAPTWGCGQGGSDLWWRYTAPCTGTATFDTCSPTLDFDSVLEVFGGTCGGLVSLGCNDDACGRGSRVTINTIAGESYYVRVGGHAGATGRFDLGACCSGPVTLPNDDCANAIVLVDGVNGPFTSSGATSSMPAWSCAPGGNDVWFRYIATCGASLRFDTCSATRTFDTTIQVFDGSCGSLIPVACNDDTCGYGSAVTIPNTVAGTTYLVRVGGYSSATGEFDVTVAPTGSGSFGRDATGCGGLTIAEVGNPNVGGRLSITLGGPGAVTGAVLYGFAPASVPLCAPAPCAFGLQSAGAIAGPHAVLGVPCQPSLAGSTAFFQGVTIAPGGCTLLGFLNVTVSDTIRATIGS